MDLTILNESPYLGIGFFFVFGLIWGSFANVVILRLPQGENVAWPGSYCRSTQKPIPWYDNIPVLSWVFLRGRSRFDGSPISIRYPLVELLMGVLFAMAFWRWGLSISLLEALVLIFSLVTCSFIDIDHFILPDVFTLSGILIGLLGSMINPARDFQEAAAGVLIGGGILYATALFYEWLRNKEGMGGGDIKLLGWLGAVLGWKAVPFVIFASTFLGALGAIPLTIKSGKGMQTAIPFGPFISLAALIFLFLYWPLGEGALPPLPMFTWTP